MGARYDEFAGRHILITGAASGIGQACAVEFARCGAKLSLCDLQAETATAAEAQKLGAQVQSIALDVADEQAVISAFAQAESSFGPLQVLVNNAGIQRESPADAISMADFDKVLNIDMRGAFMCAREALRSFLKHATRGSIVNMSSVHQVIPRPDFISYSMSKGAIGNMTRTLALEYADRGIRVNAVAPGATATPINSDWVGDPARLAAVAAHIPMARVAQPVEVARAVLYLASNDAAYVTGHTLVIDGGLCLYPSFREPWSA